MSEEKRVFCDYAVEQSIFVGNKEVLLGVDGQHKAELDEVINELREDKGLLHNRYDMRAFARRYPISAFQGNYCVEYGFRADTEKHAFLFRCNPTRGDYNFYCYCYVKEWLDKHIGRAEKGIRFIDPHYKELFRIPDGGKVIVTTAWKEKTEYPCRFIDEYHTEICNNLYHICEFAERMERNGATYEPKPQEPPSIECGVQELKAALISAEVENPIDMEHIKLALQGYNFGNGYISWAKSNYGGYSYANAVKFSTMQAERLGWSSYGDTQYVAHVLRYYPYGRAFTSGGNQAIVEVALTQLGNEGGQPYWSWYGFNGRVEWCACFVSWCADQCGYLESGIIPKFSGCVDGSNWFKGNGQWQDRNYDPSAGAIKFKVVMIKEKRF